MFEPDLRVIRAALEAQDFASAILDRKLLIVHLLDKSKLFNDWMAHLAGMTVGQEKIEHAVSVQLHKNQRGIFLQAARCQKAIHQGGDLINRREGQRLDRPHVVGYQASGIVREIGDGVTAFTPGQRVVAMMMKGSHAELASVSARKVWAIPDTISFEEAAASLTMPR